MTTIEGARAPGAGPEVRLLNRLSDWSLNAYKARADDWEEKLDAGPFAVGETTSHEAFAPTSFAEYWMRNFEDRTFFQWLLNVSWDFSSEVGPVSFRSMPTWFGEYAVSRAAWTPEQRERVRVAPAFRRGFIVATNERYVLCLGAGRR